MTALEQPLKKFVCIVIAMLWLLNLNSQSIYTLVPNYSFETHLNCTDVHITNAYPWSSPIGSGNFYAVYDNVCNPTPGNSLPLFLNGLDYQYPRTGNGLAAMYFLYQYGSNTRNYVTVQLTDSLINGKCYYAEFFVALLKTANYAVNNISLHISDTALRQPSNGKVININPQIVNYRNPIITDTLNWIKVSGIYIAHGGEKYVSIGNFKNDALTDTINTNFPGAIKEGAYFLDDVSVIPIEQDHFQLNANAGHDTTITTGDSVFIGSLLGGTISTTWYNSAGNTIATNVPGLYVSPTQNTFYVLEQNFCTYSSRDTVYVTVTALPLKLVSFAATKRAKYNLVKWQTASENNTDYFAIERSTNGKDFSPIGTVKAAGYSSENRNYNFIDDNPPLSIGTLYYRLKMVDKDGKFTYSSVRLVEKGGEVVTILPNPSSDGSFTIKFNEKIPGHKNILITDIFGRTVFQKDGFKNQLTTIKLKEASGVYLITITDALTKNRETSQLIIQ